LLLSLLSPLPPSLLFVLLVLLEPLSEELEVLIQLAAISLGLALNLASLGDIERDALEELDELAVLGERGQRLLALPKGGCAALYTGSSGALRGS
jgi:hypothetical protein